jgi:hypothetical protein
MLIHQQNLYVPRGKQRFNRHEGHSHEPVNTVKKTLCSNTITKVDEIKFVSDLFNGTASSLALYSVK